MAILDDLLVRTEAALERRLCGLAICQPKEIAPIDIHPEVDLRAREFFQSFDPHRVEILAADELESIRIAFNCCPTMEHFYLFWRAVDQVSTYENSQTIAAELTAARTARKAIRWVEVSGILKEVAYG